MKRRDLLRLFCAGLGCLFTGQSYSAYSRQTSKVKGQAPNVIFILTDDHRWDAMGCAGNKTIKTPNIDGLAKDGIMFRNAYITSSICAPSRATIFTGQYCRRHGINDFTTGFTETQWNNTYPMLLKNAGYRTGFIGKFGVGRNMPEKNFDFSYDCHWPQPNYKHTDEKGNYVHLTSMLTTQTLNFLQNSEKKRPFCLSISFKAPHVQDNDPKQFVYDPKYNNMYEKTYIPEPQTAKPEYARRLYKFLLRSEARRRWSIRFSTPDLYQESVKGYYRLVAGVDEAIAKIRSELKRQGLEKNTIIIFSGDNGFLLGEHGLAGKWFGYEESIRVPLIIYDPRLPASKRGQSCEKIALNVDIAPTILSMANVSIPESMQGRNLLLAEMGEKIKWRKDFLYEHYFEHAFIPKSEGVVSSDWKYLVYFEQDQPNEELYDLKNDRYETANLALDSRFKDKLVEFRKRLKKLKKECT